MSTNAPEIFVSDDRLSASVNIPPDYSGTPDDIFQILQQEKIVFGIDSEAIKSGVETAKSGQAPHTFVTASGTPPTDACDGTIELTFNPSGTPGHIAASGNIDYRESDTIVSVHKNQTLALLTPPTNGVPGIDVFGKKIVPSRRRGRPQRLRSGRNAKLVENKIIATGDGYVSINGNSVNVSEHLTIQKDVDYSVGNIHFKGHITIKGDIHPGFIVEAEDDIIVQGSATDAIIRSGRNVLVQHGIDGQGKACVTAAGNVRIGFVENSSVEAGGDINVASHVINSKLRAGGSIQVTKGKGVVIASDLKAGSMIEVKIAGHETANRTLLSLGGGLEADRKIDEADHEITLLKHNLQHLKNLIGEKDFAILHEDPRIIEELPKDEYRKIIQKYLDTEAHIIILQENKRHLLKEIEKQKQGIIKIREQIGGCCMIEIGTLHMAEEDPKSGPLTYSADLTEGAIRESGG